MNTTIILMSSLLAGCAVQPRTVDHLAEEGGRRCIDRERVTAQRVERGQLIYQLSGGETVRNTLKGRCPPLERAIGVEIVQVDNAGPQLCRGDSVRIYDPVTVGAGGPGSALRCPLGNFETVSGR